MARGDVRPIVSNHRGGGYSRSRTERTHDDEGRGRSNDVWEWFQRNFLDNQTKDAKFAWLMDLDDDMCYQLVKVSTMRYGLMDITFVWSPGWSEESDTRAHRLVIKHLDEAKWCAFHVHLIDGYNREKNQREMAEHARDEERRGRWAAYEAQQEAKRITVEREDWEAIHETVDFTAGTLSSELNQSFTHDDAVGYSGEWIEDAVDTYQDGSGFGYDTKKASGIKLQITLSLDLSNSMYYNGINKVAATSFRDLGLTLRRLKAEYPDDLYVSFYTFSEDLMYGNPKRGMRATRLEEPRTNNSHAPEIDFGQFRNYLPSIINSWYNAGDFDGTDTYFAPLFKSIAEWEQESSDPGAVRLDIILTDYVAEHKSDIEECDKIQERRNGNLQTVMLNFMPETEWAMSSLPKRCFMMKVDKDNIAGILRNILSEFVAVHI